MNLQIAIKDLCAYNFKANTFLLTSVRDRSRTDLLQQLHLNFEEINTGIQDVLSADGKSSPMGGQELDDLVSSSRALLGYVEVLSEEQLREEIPYSVAREGEDFICLICRMIDVCCAIIVREDGCVFVAQRAANQSLPFKFEFPGGKLEANESPRDCVLREVKEELNLDICIVSEQMPVSYNYPAFSIKLIPFVCRIT
eukprot:gene21084-25055_t